MTAFFKSTGSLGHRKAAIRVLFEGYDIIEIPVDGYVGMAVTAEPAYLSMLPNTRVTPPQPPMPYGEFTIASRDNKPFRLVGIYPPDAVRIADFDAQRDPPRSSYTAKWDFRQYDLQTGLDDQGHMIPFWLAIETDHPDAPIFDMEIRHPAARRMVSPGDTWVLSERRYLLGQVKVGEPVEFDMVVRWLPGRPKGDLVRTALSESKQFTVEVVSITPTDEGLHVRVRATPTPAAANGLIFGTFRLHSAQQSAPMILIGTTRGT